jgi:hypothetical protein
MPTRLQEMDQEIEAKRQRWQHIWNSKPKRDYTATEVGELKQLNDELNDLGTKRDELRELEDRVKGPTPKGSRPVVDDGSWLGAPTPDASAPFLQKGQQLADRYRNERP